MRKLKLSILLFAVVLLITACSTNAQPKTVESKTTPQPGLALVKGTLTKSGTALQHTLVRLGTIYGEGTDAIYVYNESADPSASTTEEGYFEFNDLKPGQYAFLYVDENGNAQPVNETPDKIYTVDAKADTTIDMGTIAIP